MYVVWLCFGRVGPNISMTYYLPNSLYKSSKVVKTLTVYGFDLAESVHV